MERKSLLGLCNVYRFVPNFAVITAPVSAKLKKGNLNERPLVD